MPDWGIRPGNHVHRLKLLLRQSAHFHQDDRMEILYHGPYHLSGREISAHIEPDITAPEKAQMANQTESFRNRFQMKKELGKGATGVVYLAFDNYLQKDVALKLTQLNLFDDDEDGTRNRRMWLNETRLAGKLQHPFIVHVIESGNSDEFDYLVME